MDSFFVHSWCVIEGARTRHGLNWTESPERPRWYAELLEWMAFALIWFRLVDVWLFLVPDP